MSLLALQEDLDPLDLGDPRQLEAIYALAGTFPNATTTAANDQALKLFILVLIWVCSHAIYRANPAVFAWNRQKVAQIEKGARSALDPLQTLALLGFAENAANFWAPPPPCQMNSSPTNAQLFNLLGTLLGTN